MSEQAQGKSAVTAGPLNGVRVLELTAHLAGPFAGMVLADLGAEVIKIEPPVPRDAGVGGAVRYQQRGTNAYFLSFNRSKKSLAVDMKSPRGKEVFYSLVGKSDVVLDNFRVGVLERLGTDYDSLKKINPRIISCSITGFGPTGPYRDRPAYDLIVQAMGGGMSITGHPGTPPCRAGLPVGDTTAAFFTVQGVLAALYGRERTGQGQKVNIALLDGQIAQLCYMAVYYFLSGEMAGPQGSGHPSNPVYRAFKTRDRYLTVAGYGGFWEPFCRAIGRLELPKDPRFETELKRFENQEQLFAILEAVFETKTADEWMVEFLREKVPAGPVNDLAHALSDPQVLHNRMVVTVVHHDGEKLQMPGNPIKMSSIPTQRYHYPPDLGQHTDEILTGLLGYSGDEISQLKNQKVVL